MSTCMRIDSAQALDNVSCCSCSIGFKLNAGECDCKHGHHDGYLCEASFTICGSVKFQIAYAIMYSYRYRHVWPINIIRAGACAQSRFIPAQSRMCINWPSYANVARCICRDAHWQLSQGPIEIGFQGTSFDVVTSVWTSW